MTGPEIKAVRPDRTITTDHHSKIAGLLKTTMYVPERHLIVIRIINVAMITIVLLPLQEETITSLPEKIHNLSNKWTEAAAGLLL
jgi:hypothetical protein